MSFNVPPRSFWWHEERFAYDAVSWKFLTGTLHTNLSQVRLETYLVGFSGHGFTKAQGPRGAMKPKTRFSLAQEDEIQNFNMRRRVSWELVAGPCLSPRNLMEQRAAEWAICRGREMRIQNFNMQPVFNAQSLATGKRRFGPKVPRFHLLIC